MQVKLKMCIIMDTFEVILVCYLFFTETWNWVPITLVKSKFCPRSFLPDLVAWLKDITMIFQPKQNLFELFPEIFVILDLWAFVWYHGLIWYLVSSFRKQKYFYVVWKPPSEWIAFEVSVQLEDKSTFTLRIFSQPLLI